jgi:hypothetical protein
MQKPVKINGAIKNAEKARKTPREMMWNICALALRGS